MHLALGRRGDEPGTNLGVRRRGRARGRAEDPAFGFAIALWVGLVVADRLHASGTRMLDLCAPHDSGGPA